MFYHLVVVCCLCVLWRLWSKKQSASDPPELSGKLLIVGHAYMLMGDGVKMFKTVARISEECLAKGGIVTIHLGPRKVYAIADPEDSLTLMNTCLKKHYIYDFMKPLIGNGLITADVPTWKRNRKLLNPAFSQQVLDSFIDIFNTQARSLVDRFSTETGKLFDHEYWMRVNSLERVCATTLGVDSSDYSDLLKQYLPRLTKLVQMLHDRIQKFWLHSDFIFEMTQESKITDEELEYVLHALSKTILQNKKMERKNKMNTITKTGKLKPFIDLILDIADETGCYTDEYLREETDTVIAGGHDTTASILTLTLTMLGSHTDVQDRAYEEIMSVLGNTKTNVQKTDISKLVYIEAVLKETLRLYPGLPILGRNTEKDVKLKNYTIKANSDVFLLVYGLHRQNIWGPDVEQFRPERWLDKETLPDLKYYCGFGMGKRNCIGQIYAMMSMKIIIAHILQNYCISSDVSKMKVQMQTMIRPESGHYISLAKRNK